MTTYIRICCFSGSTLTLFILTLNPLLAVLGSRELLSSKQSSNQLNLSIKAIKSINFRLGAVHKGRPQRRGGGKVKCGHMRTGGGKGPCGRPQDGTFSIVSPGSADTPYRRCLLKYKLLFILFDLHHRL